MASSAIQNQVFSRTEALELVPVISILGCAAAPFGALAGVATILTGGFQKDIASFAAARLELLQLSPSLLFMSAIHILNPGASFGDPKARIALKGDGLLTEHLKSVIREMPRHLKHSDFFERHILSRAGFLVFTVAFLVTRIADLVLGMIAVVFSILTLGCFASINNAAFRGLQFFGVIGDLVHGIAGVINPAVEFDATHYGTSLGKRILEKVLVTAAGQTQAQLIAAEVFPNIRRLLPA